MKKNTMYFDVHHTKICKDIYRPSSNLFRLLKSVWTVLWMGQSPIGHSSIRKSRFH